MTEEKTPHYIHKLKEDLTKHFDEKIEKEIGDLAASTAKEFAIVHSKLADHDKRFDDIDFKFDTIDNQLYTMNERMEKIEGHIGRYEIRAQNIEEMLQKDIKTSIRELEKVVFGV